MSVNLTPNAESVFRLRYSRKGPDGQPIETVEDTFRRVARAISESEPKDTREFFYEEAFYNMMTDLKFLPNSPTFFGAGTPLGNLAACYVLNINDDMGADPEGIFSTLRTAALIQQSGGGNGFSFSRLRPKGAVVKSSMGEASGPVSFMKAYNGAFDAIQQGGARRSANMAVLEVSHPDIEEFISCKDNENTLTNFNISVGITDDFMQAVLKEDSWDLVFEGKVYKTVDAKDLFDRIVRHAHFNGEPGVLFLDRANRDHPTPHLGRLEATNPCGEQFLLGYENCCLGSINLAKHISEDGKDVDWNELRDTVCLAVRFLDNVIDVNKYIPAIPEVEAAAKLTRRIGLGIMGLADVFYQLRVRYGSKESLILAEKIMEFVHYWAMFSSIELAQQRGVFQAYEGSIFDPDSWNWTPPALSPDAHDDVDWPLIEGAIKRYGIRNAAVTTIAPTGTLSTVAGVEGYGCEPVFALAYTRYVMNGDARDPLQYVSPLFSEALNKAHMEFAAFYLDDILDEVERTGSCAKLSVLPAWIRDTFVVSADILPEEHVAMQASLQKYVSNAISKTCNFPNEASVEDVKKAYIQAWEQGCKGLTVYVTGSRDKVVLETKEIKDSKVYGVDWASGEDQSVVQAVWTGDPATLGYLATTSTLCPNCENASLQFIEGCIACVCGYSMCTI